MEREKTERVCNSCCPQPMPAVSSPLIQLRMGKLLLLVMLAYAAVQSARAQAESTAGQLSSASGTTLSSAGQSPTPAIEGGVMSRTPVIAQVDVISSTGSHTTPGGGNVTNSGHFTGEATAPVSSSDVTSLSASADGTESVSTAGGVSSVTSGGLTPALSSVQITEAVTTDRVWVSGQTTSDTADQALTTSTAALSSAGVQLVTGSSITHATPGEKSGSDQSTPVAGTTTVSSSSSGQLSTASQGLDESVTANDIITVRASVHVNVVTSLPALRATTSPVDARDTFGPELTVFPSVLASAHDGQVAVTSSLDTVRSSGVATSSSSVLLEPSVTADSQTVSPSPTQSVPPVTASLELPVSIQSFRSVNGTSAFLPSSSMMVSLSATSDTQSTVTLSASTSSEELYSRTISQSEHVPSFSSDSLSPLPSGVPHGITITSSVQTEMFTSSSSIMSSTMLPTPDLPVSLSVTSVIATMPSTAPPMSPETISTTSTASSVVLVTPTATSAATTTSTISVLANATTIVTTPRTKMTTPRMNTTTPSHQPKTHTQKVRYMFILSGNCHLVLNNSEYFGRFLAAFHDLLTKHLHIPDNTYKLGDVTCGSVRVYVTFMNVVMPEFDVMIQTAIHNGGRGLAVPVWLDSGQFMTFELTHAEQVELKADVDTYNIVSTVMDDVDIIVIIVACCVCGVLIAIGIAICVKECYRRKHAQSFDLLEIPHVNLKLEDFTLTRIPRPKTIYTEGSSVTMKSFTPDASSHQNGGSHSVGASSNGHTRTPSINAEDMHIRVKSHSDGIVIGITGSPTHCPSTRGDPFSNGTLKKARTRTPLGDVCPEEDEYQASERLLGEISHGDAEGTMNPVFVDETGGEEGLGEREPNEGEAP